METWYVLEDGAYGDPRDVRTAPDGKLHHKDGRAVAYAPHGPRSRNVDPDMERAKTAKSMETAANPTSRDMTAADDKSAADDREMKPAASGKGYRTRGAKSE